MEITPSTASASSYAIFSPLDIYKREVYQKVFNKVPRASALTWMRHLKGRWSKRRTIRHTYSFYENGQWFNGAAKISAIATSGAKFLITLDAESHTDLEGTNDGSYPVKNNNVVFKDGSTQGFIESVNRTSDGAHVLTVQKANTSQDIGTVATVGSHMVFFSNAQPERSKKTESRVPRYDKITNKMQTIRQEFEVTDHEMQNAVEFPVGPNGEPYLYYQGIIDTAERFELDRELAHLLNVQFSAVVDDTGAAVDSMEGVIPQTRAHGTNFDYSNRPDFSDFQTVMLGLDNAYGEHDYVAGLGHNLEQGMTDWLLNFAQAGTGNISFASVGGKNTALEIGLKSVSINSYSFHLQKWGVFSHKDSLGAPGLPFRNMAVLLPTGMEKNPDPEGDNSRDGMRDYEPHIQVVYSEPVCAPQYKHGDHMVFETGALSRQGATSDELVREVHMVGYYSTEQRCRNRFGLWEAA